MSPDFQPKTNAEFSVLFRQPVAYAIGSGGEVPSEVDTLHFLANATAFARLPEYPNVRAIAINNVTFAAKERAGLAAAAKSLSRIKFLQLWNCTGFTDSLFGLFTGVEHLQLAHKDARRADWRCLEVLPRLSGLFLVNSTKLRDLDVSCHVESRLATLSIVGAKSLMTTSGVRSLRRTLERLTLWGGLDHPPRKRFGPLDVSELAELESLRSLSISGLSSSAAELGGALEKLSSLEELELDPWEFETSFYATLRQRLPKVNCRALNPYVEEGGAILPVGRGKKMLVSSSKSFAREREKIVAQWEALLERSRNSV